MKLNLKILTPLQNLTKFLHNPHHTTPQQTPQPHFYKTYTTPPTNTFSIPHYTTPSNITLHNPFTIRHYPSQPTPHHPTSPFHNPHHTMHHASTNPTIQHHLPEVLQHIRTLFTHLNHQADGSQ